MRTEPGPLADRRLLDAATELADDLHRTLAGVLPVVPPLVRARAVRAGGDVGLAIEQGPRTGIPLTVDGLTILRLRGLLRCAWDGTGEHLAVRRSSFSVVTESTAEPLFRYDYDAGSDGKVPAAHLNVHGHRDELVFAMMAAGHRLRGRARTAAVRRGRVPRVSTLHFPLGGHRFRPAFEDVLEMLVREFGLDTRDGWQDAIRAGRERWRGTQLRAAVRDDPGSAAAELGRLGYQVAAPASVPAGRADRLVAL